MTKNALQRRIYARQPARAKTHMQQKVVFKSKGLNCSGLFHLPDNYSATDDVKLPAIAMARGIGTTKEMGLGPVRRRWPSSQTLASRTRNFQQFSKRAARAEAILKQIISNAPIGVKFSIEAINKGLETSLTEGLLFEASLFAGCFDTEDKEEGTSAFLERRVPHFRGR
jgi:enoyl-CoA hydratase/carnithine racemase